jgi:hypothetical protein
MAFSDISKSYIVVPLKFKFNMNSLAAKCVTRVQFNVKRCGERNECSEGFVGSAT